MSIEPIKIRPDLKSQAGPQTTKSMSAANDEVAMLNIPSIQTQQTFSVKTLTFVVLFHAAALFGMLYLHTKQNAEIEMPEPAPMMVSLVSEPAPDPEPEVVEIVPEPEPVPVVKKVKPVPKKVVEPTPIPEPVQEPVQAAPVAQPEPEKVSAPMPAPVVAKQEAPVIEEKPIVQEVVEPPKFGASYLHNPAPSYPAISRRMGEEGRVMLRVLVSKNGDAEQVQIETGSGSSRLDNAALEAVKKWRFIPAKRNNQPISAFVIVPIQFTLNS